MKTHLCIFVCFQINFKQSMSQLSVKTSESGVLDPLSGAHLQPMTAVGLYKGQIVALKSLPKLSGELARNDLIELKEV